LAAAETLVFGATLSDEEISRFDRVDQFFRGRDKVLQLLSKRARTRHQMATALESMAIESSIQRGILSELEELGLIDDARFTREYVKLKVEVRRLGPYRLRHDLKRLGVHKTIVDEVLDETFDTEVQMEMAKDVAGRRTGGARVDEKVARRISGFLQRKGFDFEVVNRVVYDLLHSPETNNPDSTDTDN
jgi:regulatory protein